MGAIKHYGWQVSPYSAKTRSYLRYAGVVFDDLAPSLKTLLLEIRPAVGAAVMPTVRLADGRYLKDSSNIIDHFEAVSHAPSITPEGARQRIASAVLEVYADEWLPLAALHYRWSRAENARFAIREFGKYAAPWLPSPLQHLIGRQLAAKMQGYQSILGITPRTAPAIEQMTVQLLDDLDSVLREQPYVLGGRPSLADFALYGPLYAHLYRDPATTFLFAGRPSLRAWILRMRAPEAQGNFLADDALAPGVERILQRAFTDQWDYLQKLVALIDGYVQQHPQATRVPRALGMVDIHIGGVQVSRKAVTFAHWKMQRACAVYAGLDAGRKQLADEWLAALGGRALTKAPAHPLVYVGNRLKLA